MATIDKPQQHSGEQQFKVIGTRPIRHDGVDKVTGRARYGADIYLTGMLHGAVLRSPYGHARIQSIDTSQAEALPGVRAVVTGADLPDASNRVADLGEGAVNLQHLSWNVLAGQKALYKGHAVAAIAADSVHIAEEACRLIEVDYEPLQPVLTAPEAMKDDAPILLDDLRTESLAGEASDRPTNIAKHFRYEKGDLQQGYQEAAVVIEREFNTATVHQGYIEPHAATALWNADGHVTVWSCTQGSFSVRQQMADLLNRPVSHVKVVPTEIGGGFGGKISVYLEPVAALLSKKTGKPVKLVMDRASVFESTGPTPGSSIWLKMGCDEQGRITAAEAYLAYEAGAFPGSPINPGCMCVFSCYDIPHARVDGYDVCVNKPRSNAYRAPGSTHAAFAIETVIDEICAHLDLDPIQFRLNNAAKEGTRRVDGVVYPRIGMWETTKAIHDSDHWNSPLEASGDGKQESGKKNVPATEDSRVKKLRGRGVASGFWFNAGLKSSVTASVNADGKVSLIEGSTDIGGTRTSIAMQLAETLGIPAEDVNPTVVDTDAVGYTDVTGGSRVTFSTGWAAYEAGRDIQRQMVERAALIWDVDPSRVHYEDGRIVGPDGNQFTFQQLAAQAAKVGEPIIGRGSSNPEQPGGGFGTHVVDIEVDPETGKVDILRYTAAQDAGRAIHPSYVEGQMQGGVAQGIGWALNEEYFYNDRGVMENASYLDYRIPTCYDLPMIETIIVEVPNPGHPYGVRGVGEVPIVPPPAAIANALDQAVGVRMRQLPMSPPRVLHEILRQREAGNGQIDQ